MKLRSKLPVGHSGLYDDCPSDYDWDAGLDDEEPSDYDWDAGLDDEEPSDYDWDAGLEDDYEVDPFDYDYE
jgi:hypothetical protein